MAYVRISTEYSHPDGIPYRENVADQKEGYRDDERAS